MSRSVNPKIVSLVSDFGVKDPFVGIMKGVMAGIDPGIRFFDLTHLIGAQDIFHGCMVLKSAYTYFPKGTVHLAVIDPGVGGTRKGLAIESKGYYFVGPDNGVFSFLFNDKNSSFSAIELKNNRYFRSPVSSTFHGRDIFAPVSAHLASGCPIAELGVPLCNPVNLIFPLPVVSGEAVTGEVIYIDQFGNLATNITKEELGKIEGDTAHEPVFLIAGREGKLLAAYPDAGKGELAGVINSWGALEIFVNNGNAMKALGAEKGVTVTVHSTE